MDIRQTSIAIVEAIHAHDTDRRYTGIDVNECSDDYTIHLVITNEKPEFSVFHPGRVYVGQPIITYMHPKGNTISHVIVQEKLQELYDDYVNGYANL